MYTLLRYVQCVSVCVTKQHYVAYLYASYMFLFFIVFTSSNILNHKKQLSDPKKVAPSIEELNGATIVLTAEAAAGAEPQDKEDEGSTLEITPMLL